MFDISVKEFFTNTSVYFYCTLNLLSCFMLILLLRRCTLLKYSITRIEPARCVGANFFIFDSIIMWMFFFSLYLYLLRENLVIRCGSTCLKRLVSELYAEIPSSHPKVMFDYSNIFLVDIYILNSLKFPRRMLEAALIS